MTSHKQACAHNNKQFQQEKHAVAQKTDPNQNKRANQSQTFQSRVAPAIDAIKRGGAHRHRGRRRKHNVPHKVVTKKGGLEAGRHDAVLLRRNRQDGQIKLVNRNAPRGSAPTQPSWQLDGTFATVDLVRARRPPSAERGGRQAPALASGPVLHADN